MFKRLFGRGNESISLVGLASEGGNHDSKVRRAFNHAKSLGGCDQQVSWLRSQMNAAADHKQALLIATDVASEMKYTHNDPRTEKLFQDALDAYHRL